MLNYNLLYVELRRCCSSSSFDGLDELRLKQRRFEPKRAPDSPALSPTAVFFVFVFFFKERALLIDCVN